MYYYWFKSSQPGPDPIPANRHAWTAPEVNTHNDLNASTDVYSFGVLVWEILNLGATPSAGL